MEEQPVRQAFGSPGGKSYLAPKIVGMIPPHRVYVEPFAGGAAVYFKKSPSEVEVLSDKDREIAFAFRFLRDMTREQFERLKRYNWKISKGLFKRLKASEPRDDVERFRRFYYTKKGSFKLTGETVDTGNIGKKISIDRLPKVHERLRRTAVHGGDALAMIRKYDNSHVFFYLDPPYPSRASVGGNAGRYTEEDLEFLIDRLKGVKGKFALSLGTEHTKLLPKSWHIKRVWVRRSLVPSQTGVVTPSQYEIVATNYNPDTVRPVVAKPPFVVGRSAIRRKPKPRRRYVPLTPSLAGTRG